MKRSCRATIRSASGSAVASGGAIRSVAMAVRKYYDGLFIAQMTFTADGTTVTGTCSSAARWAS